MVLWRDSAGHPHIFEDRCPHRAARLSAGARESGRIQGNTFACWYHGATFDPTGACTVIPGEGPSAPGEERLRIKVYPAAERAGFIWIYHGEGQAPALAVPSELEDPNWCGFRTVLLWHTNWLNIMDNLSDPLHQYALHARAYTTMRRPPFNRVRVVEETDERLRLVQYLDNEDGTVIAEEPFGFELVLPNVLRVELLNAAPGGNVRVVMLMTPVDEDTTFVCFFRAQQVSGLARLRWQAVWHLFYRRAVYRVAAQDEAMLSTLGPLSETRVREHLTASDIGVVHFRRLLHRAFARGQGGADQQEAMAAEEWVAP
jgi:phenylpropionate dioxygenase-like ring-hydroxylating dioxygenase large terminal subunit